jgi:hypothetical protein
MDNEQLTDSLFEALFRQAVIDDYVAEIDGIPPNEELAKIYSFSPEFELRMKKVFARYRRKEIFVRITKYIKRVAVVFLLASTVLFGILLINPEVRAAVGKVVVEWFEKFTSITFSGEEMETNEDMGRLRTEYMPDGYFQSSIEYFGNRTQVIFSNDSSAEIRFIYSPGKNIANFSIDNENHTIENYMIGNASAFIAAALNNDFDNGIIFNVENYDVEIWGKIPVDELIKMAESVIENKSEPIN